MFLLLIKRADDAVFDDFPKINTYAANTGLTDCYIIIMLIQNLFLKSLTCLNFTILI